MLSEAKNDARIIENQLRFRAQRLFVSNHVCVPMTTDPEIVCCKGTPPIILLYQNKTLFCIVIVTRAMPRGQRMTYDHVRLTVSYQSQSHSHRNMERVVWEIFVLLLFSLASECGGISDKAAEEPRKRHLFVQRSQPLPGSSKKLLKIEYEEPPRFSAEQEEPEFLRRVRRSVDPDMNPEAHVVRIFVKVLHSLK